MDCGFLSPFFNKYIWNMFSWTCFHKHANMHLTFLWPEIKIGRVHLAREKLKWEEMQGTIC